VETTGGSPEQSRVTEIGMVEVLQGLPKRRFSTLVNPGLTIPTWITRLTGITDTMVQTAPRFEQVADRVERWIGDGLFVAHCAHFDYGFLQHEFARSGRVFSRPYLCTRQLARRVLPGLSSYGLGSLTRQVGLRVRNRHRALGDAAATARLLSLLLQRARQDGIDVSSAMRTP